MSRTSKAWEALQNRLSQTVETVTRSSRVDVVGGGIDEIDPPEDLDEFAEQARTTGPVRKNLRQYVNDVWEPGYDIEAESEATRDYFMGGDAAPEGTPEGGFLKNSGIYGGERHQDFYDFGKETTWQRWVRGTILVELLKAERENPESPITGFYHIRPETVYPQVQNNTNILLPPDKENLPEDIDQTDIEETPRGEVAAYIQFDDESILGLRRNGFDNQEVPLSQNDVMKQTLEPDIGDDFTSSRDGGSQGVFGTSIIEGISEDIAEYKQIKRDRGTAISTKAYGVWKASFGRETIDLGNNQKELIEWDDSDQDDFTDELGTLGPGDIVTHDGTIDFDKFASEVPDLVETINQYISIMLAPLPAPKYMIGFAEGINRDVTEEQKEAYHDLVNEERRYQEKKWTKVFRTVAERQDLDTEGLQLVIQPEQETNPVKRLDSDEIERMNTYVNSLAVAAGPQAGPTALVDRESLLEVLDFPMDELDAEEAMQELDDSADHDAWADVLGVEAMQAFEDSETVDTPDGFGIIDDIITEGTVDGMDATEEEPVYAVVVEDEDIGVGFYREGELRSGSVEDLPGPEDPTDDLEAMFDIADATLPEDEHVEALKSAYVDGDLSILEFERQVEKAVDDTEALQDGFFSWPESWEESETPARVIALKAWAGMNGSFTGCTREMRGNVTRPEAFCADFKDRLYGTEKWRGGWAD